MLAVIRQQQPARLASSGPALPAAVVAVRDAAAALAARLRAATVSSPEPEAYTRAAAASTAAQLTAQAWLLLEAALPPGPAADPGQAARSWRDPLLAGADAPLLASAARVLGGVSSWLAARPGQLSPGHLAGAAACLAAASSELARISPVTTHLPGPR